MRRQILPPELASSKQWSGRGGVVISVRRRKDGGVAIESETVLDKSRVSILAFWNFLGSSLLWPKCCWTGK